ncbi:MAG: GNAT family N-acetyltransferase [Bacteroidales bacterium]|nr:GNAT family N-acetyltransferase [Bacteroidales bacterium]
MSIRAEVRTPDPEAVRKIVKSTGFFRDDEIAVAVELVEETLLKGKDSGYEFLFIDHKDNPVAYSCFGLIPCSLLSWDLYWIVTHHQYRGKGLGSMLLMETERIVQARGGKAVYAETSSKEQYLPTRMFYEKNGYTIKARFEDFYDLGDDKIVYMKLTGSAEVSPRV